MSEESNSGKQFDDLEAAAKATCGVIIVFFLVYWAIQIESAYSLLAMAYEW